MGEMGVSVFVSGRGFPDRRTISEFHKLRIVVGCIVGNESHAEKALKGGVDLLIAQGTEGGGHTGLIGSFVLIPAIVDLAKRWAVPVLAAGICEIKFLFLKIFLELGL